MTYLKAQCWLVATIALFFVAPVAAQSSPSTDTASLPGLGESQHRAESLQRVLSEMDAALYQAIFKLQEVGKWRSADKRIAKLSDRVLIGHVLYQRYMHPTAYRSKYKELKEWMDSYADHPGASRIYRLALRRQPKGWRGPKKPLRTSPVHTKSGARQRVQNKDFLSRSQRRLARQVSIFVDLD